MTSSEPCSPSPPADGSQADERVAPRTPPDALRTLTASNRADFNSPMNTGLLDQALTLIGQRVPNRVPNDTTQNPVVFVCSGASGTGPSRKSRCRRGFRSGVARPGLEPGTPRFSVKTCADSDQADLRCKQAGFKAGES